MSEYTSFGRVVGTIPERRKRRPKLKKTTVLPNWTWEEAIAFCKKNVRWNREDWYPISEFQKNQGGVGSCNFYMQGGITERLIRKQFGFYVKLSPEFGYAEAVNGRDMGSLLTESLALGQKVGLPPYERRHWQKYSKSDFTREDRTNAAFFRGFEWEPIDTWLEGFIALCLDYPLATAIHAGRNYESIQTSGKYRGFCGVDNGKGNHAVLCDKPVVINGIPGAEQPGSWGTNIHKEGIAVLHGDHFKQTMPYHQFWIGTGVRINRTEIENRFGSRITYP